MHAVYTAVIPQYLLSSNFREGCLENLYCIRKTPYSEGYKKKKVRRKKERFSAYYTCTLSDTGIENGFISCGVGLDAFFSTIKMFNDIE